MQEAAQRARLIREAREAVAADSLPAEWIKYETGELPIVISVPHDGPLKPESVPDRQHGCFTHGVCKYEYGCKPQDTQNRHGCKVDRNNDMSTRNIATLITEKLQQRTGARPHLLVNMLHRTKLDANRPVDAATDGIGTMMAAYTKFMGLAESIRTNVTDRCSAALWIDVHGHKQNDKVMLGYDIPEHLFESTDDELDEPSARNAEHSTIRHLAERSPAAFSSLLRGDNALGTYLWAEGVEAVPSQQFPKVGDAGGKYLDGATIVTRFGSKFKGGMDAVQLEIPQKWRLGDNDSGISREEANEQFADRATNAIVKFFQNAYRVDIEDSGPATCDA